MVATKVILDYVISQKMLSLLTSLVSHKRIVQKVKGNSDKDISWL